MSDTSSILILEDDQDQGKMLVDYLTFSGGFEVNWVSTIETFWQVVNQKRYDLVVLDYRLGEGTGLDVLKNLPERGFNLPAIMITGMGDEKVAAQAIQAGASEYIIKKDDYYTKLPSIIRRAIDDYSLKQSIEKSIERIRFQAILLDNIRDAVVGWDNQGIITFWNTPAEKLFGLAAEKMIGTSVEQTYFPSFDPKPCQIFSQASNENEIERKVLSHKGKDVWISSKITPLYADIPGSSFVGYMDVIRDISERKSAEKELNKLKSAVEQTVDAVIITNREGIIEFINPAFERLSGLDRNLIIGASIDIIHSSKSNSEYYKNLWKTILSGGIFRGEFVKRDEKGNSISLEEIVAPIHNDDGEISNLIVTIRDMTEHRKMEAQVRVALAKLNQSSRLAAIGELASGIAHRIYNPLTTIIADAQMLLRNPDNINEALESIEDMEKAGWKAQEVVKQLLDFSRPDSGTLKLISINQTINSALILVGAHIQASGVNLVVELEDGLPPIYGNERQIEDLWVNLLLQARDATADSRKHIIRVSSQKTTGGHILIEIWDDGKQIPPDQIIHIFEPNFIGSTIGRGTGLELSICREIVRQNKGKIRVKSDKNGTAFQIELQCIDGKKTRS